jgi:molecular chaperone DnaK (HSP70)
MSASSRQNGIRIRGKHAAIYDLAIEELLRRHDLAMTDNEAELIARLLHAYQDFKKYLSTNVNVNHNATSEELTEHSRSG